MIKRESCFFIDQLCLGLKELHASKQTFRNTQISNLKNKQMNKNHTFSHPNAKLPRYVDTAKNIILNTYMYINTFMIYPHPYPYTMHTHNCTHVHVFSEVRISTFSATIT